MLVISIRLEGSDLTEQVLREAAEWREVAEEYSAMAASYLRDSIRLQNELAALKLKYE